MERRTHRTVDYIPQSVVHAAQCGMRIAIYPVERFIELPVDEGRGVVIPETRRPPRSPAAEVLLLVTTIACLVAVLSGLHLLTSLINP